MFVVFKRASANNIVLNKSKVRRVLAFSLSTDSLLINCNLNNPVQLILKKVVSHLDILQLIAVGNQGCGIDFALFDQAEDLGAVAAVDAAGFEGQVLAVHIRQGQGLGLVVEGNHGDDGVGAGALPGQAESVLCAGHFQHHIGAAVVGVGEGECLAFFRSADQHIGVMFLNKSDAGRVLFADDDPLGIFQHDTQ